MHVEVIDDQSLSFGNVIHETTSLEVTFDNHNSLVVFNIIRSPSNPIILELSWLEKYNSQINWASRKIVFSIVESIITKPMSETLKAQKSKVRRLLFIGARTFKKAANQGSSFAIYATPTFEVVATSTIIPKVYEKF